MAKYYIKFDGAPEDEQEADYASADEARNAAVMLLGAYLQEHPEYAFQRHWRVDVRDHARRLVTHVIVATVDAPPPINWESFAERPEGYKRA